MDKNSKEFIEKSIEAIHILEELIDGVIASIKVFDNDSNNQIFAIKHNSERMRCSVIFKGNKEIFYHSYAYTLHLMCMENTYYFEKVNNIPAKYHYSEVVKAYNIVLNLNPYYRMVMPDCSISMLKTYVTDVLAFGLDKIHLISQINRGTEFYDSVIETLKIMNPNPKQNKQDTL